MSTVWVGGGGEALEGSYWCMLSFSICLLISFITVDPQCFRPIGVSLSLFFIQCIFNRFHLEVDGS